MICPDMCSTTEHTSYTALRKRAVNMIGIAACVDAIVGGDATVMAAVSKQVTGAKGMSVPKFLLDALRPKV